MKLHSEIVLQGFGDGKWKAKIVYTRIEEHVHNFTEVFDTELEATQKALDHLKYEREVFGIGWSPTPEMKRELYSMGVDFCSGNLRLRDDRS